MKKFIILITLLFTSIPNIYASDTEKLPVEIDLVKPFYADVSKTYGNNLTTITYKNNLLVTDLTDTELKKILSQKSGSGSTKLTYYETLNINVYPVEGTPYESLKGKTSLYRANDGGAWLSNDAPYTRDAYEVSELLPLKSNFWPYGFKVTYRKDTEGEFISTVPSGKDLSNKTLEEQIATIFDIDLSTHPNGVIELYPEKLSFKPLTNRSYALRIDFYDKSNGISPTLKDGTTDKYEISSLNKLGTEYLLIRYEKGEDASVSLNVDYEKVGGFDGKIFIPIGLVLIIIISAFVYIKKYRIKVINSQNKT